MVALLIGLHPIALIYTTGFQTTTIDVSVPSVYTLRHREPTKPLLIPDPNFEP